LQHVAGMASSRDGTYTPGAGSGSGYGDHYWANRVGVITGAGSGIGEALALACVDRGMNVVLADIDASALEVVARSCNEVRQSLAEMGGNAGRLHLARSGVSTVLCDVTKREDLRRLHDTAWRTYGAVHLVCNNAGAMGPRKGSLLDIDEDEWDWFMDLNLHSVLHGCRLFAKTMHASGEDGFIVNTASIYGLASATSAYGITKQGVVAISEAFQSALHAAGSRVTVSSLCPSFHSTNIGSAEYAKQKLPEDRQFMDAILSNSPGPDRVAKAVFDGIAAGDHYIHTDPEVSQAMFADRIEGILDSLRVTSSRHDDVLGRLGAAAGVARPNMVESGVDQPSNPASASDPEAEDLAVGADFARPVLVRRSRL
jgi:NAD(P)-dependent dehydrogenase (short-subunit alcohol dehydrogenase family)